MLQGKLTVNQWLVTKLDSRLLNWILGCIDSLYTYKDRGQIRENSSKKIYLLLKKVLAYSELVAGYLVT